MDSHLNWMETGFDPSSIKYCLIYPGIGIARLGNSPEEYFIGPEIPYIAGLPENELFKDKEGKVKRQGARFHIYGYDYKDNVIKELTSDDCSITWSVHLANTKGETKFFVGRYELPTNGTPLPSRNANVTNRKGLIIDPGVRSISGMNQSDNNSYRFDTGKFLDITVPLGEIRTDEKGRLIVLGGFGKSDSIDIEKFPIRQFANNDGWFDDTSDGPVTALVKMEDGRSIPLKDSAWVIVVPPKFAPYHYPIVTLYDTMKDFALNQNWITRPKEVSYMRDIYPIFFRVIQYKWLNEDAERGHGINTAGNVLAKFKELSDNSQNNSNLRKMIFSVIRNPDLVKNPTSADAIRQAEPNYMPPLSGDGGEANEGSIRTWMTVLPSQYENLKRWSEGDFISDWDENLQISPFQQRKLEEVALEEQPSALDKAVLESCIGAPFFPGIEMTYIVWDPSTYNNKPFRINPSLNPGDITKHMAIPWQADFLACSIDWWPAARPDDIIPEDNGSNPLETTERKKWARKSDGTDFQDYIDMVNEWSTLGFIKPKKMNDEIIFVEMEKSR